MKRKGKAEHRPDDLVPRIRGLQAELGEAFNDFHRQVLPIVTRIVKASISNRDDAEDLISEIIEAIWRKLPSYNENKASVLTWVSMIARSSIIDHFRHQKPEPVHSELDPAPSGGSAEDSLARREVLEAIMDLDEDERSILLLKAFYGLSSAELSQLLKSAGRPRSPRAVDSILYRVRRKVRERLERVD